METRTIKQIRNGEWPTGDYTFYVYVFRAGKDVLYVGESVNIKRRILEHLHGGGNKYLRAALRGNEHSDWCVDLYSTEDITTSERYRWELRMLLRNHTHVQAINMLGRKKRRKFEHTKITSLSPAYNEHGRKNDRSLAIEVAKKYYPEISRAELERLQIDKALHKQLPLQLE